MRVAILGSCTTRDSVPWWPKRMELVGYGARHPLASLLHPSEVTERDDLVAERVESPWRGRQLINDIRSTTLPILLEKKPDVIIFDVTDDRLGYVERGDGGRAAGSGCIPPIVYDSDLTSALSAIAESGPRVIMNAAEWSGSPAFNRYLRHVTGLAETMGIEVIHTRETTQSPTHKWGTAPFHLVDADYARMAKLLEETL